MEWALGNTISIRTALVGFAVVTAVTSVAVTRPKVLPLPHLSFNLASAPAADQSILTITNTDAAHATALVTSLEDVHSQQDLVAYANFLMQNDARISQIEIGAHSVSMTYQVAHSVLNVKTISDSTRATVADTGTVSVSGSWYRPLYTRVARASAPNLGFSDISLVHEGQGLSPTTEARILARLHGRFQIGAIQ